MYRIAVVAKIRVRPRDQIRAADVARIAAAGRVYDRRKASRQRRKGRTERRQIRREAVSKSPARAVRTSGCERALNYNVRTDNEDFDRHAAAGVDYAADFPVAQDRVAGAAKIKSSTPA